MSSQPEVHNLQQLLAHMRRGPRGHDRVSVSDLMQAVGSRSFGPLLLVAGLVTLSPVGDVPGVPTIMAAFVFLVAGQLLLGRESFWLPRWLLRRSVARKKFNKAIDWMRRPATWVDRLLRPRLVRLTRGEGRYAIAATCVAIALAMPPMELVPFTASVAGLALTAFGLALIAEDGLFALASFVLTSLALAWLLSGL
jgi:hypothetical protein